MRGVEGKTIEYTGIEKHVHSDSKDESKYNRNNIYISLTVP